MIINQDILWKGIIEDLCSDFLLFFFPQAKDHIDFERGFEFLDKEMAQLFPESENQQRFVDKLIKVYSKSGVEEWVLVHVEVQGYRDANFSQRMFIYYYRIVERYQKPITALAIFTDEDLSYLPSHYTTEFLGTKHIYEYNVYKVIHQDEEELSKINNPFADVVLMSLKWLKNKKSADDKILSIKMDLVRLLIKKRYQE